MGFTVSLLSQECQSTNNLYAIHWLISIPLTPEAEKSEIQQITHIAELNGLKINIPELVRRRRLRSLLPTTTPSIQTADPPTRRKWMRLPFLGRTSYKIARELRRHNFRVGFYPLLTMGSLVALKDPLPRDDRTGVYRVTCGDCGALYIGQTGRKMSKRLSEHKTKSNSAVQKHCIRSGHNLDHLSCEILHSVSKGGTMNTLEEIETVKAASGSSYLLNDLTATFSNPFIRYYFNDSSSSS